MKYTDEVKNLLEKFGFISIDEIDKLQFKPKLPKDVKGMKILGIIPNFPIDIKSCEQYFGDYNNPARNKSIVDSAEHIALLAEIMRNDDWEPSHHVPPTIEWNGNLSFNYITGNMSRKAAIAADKKTLWLCLVEFFDEDGFSADYWKEIWASNENSDDKTYAKLVRTSEDIIDQICGMVKKHIVSVSEEDNKPSILKTLSDMQITAKPKAEFHSKILQQLGFKHLAVEPKTPEDVQLEVCRYQHKYPNLFFAGASYSDVNQPKRDLEVGTKLASKYILNPKKYNKDTLFNITGVAGKGTQKIDEVRKKKDEVEDLIKSVRDFWVSVYLKEKETGIPFGWNNISMKQLEKDPAMVDLSDYFSKYDEE